VDGFSLILQQGVQGIGLAAVPFAQNIEAMIGGDAVEPGGELGITLELGQVPVGLDEDVLGGLLGLRMVLEHGEAITHHFFMILVDQVAIEVFLALKDKGYLFGVGQKKVP
jgi:hypothetical protein